MPRAGRLAAPDASAEKVAKLCGSRIVVDVVLEDGRVADFAQDVKACALGQAAAAVLGAHVVGATPDEIEMARDAFRAMLKAGGPPPDGTLFGPRHARAGEGLSAAPRLDAAGVRGDGRGVPARARPHRPAPARELAPPARLDPPRRALCAERVQAAPA